MGHPVRLENSQFGMRCLDGVFNVEVFVDPYITVYPGKVAIKAMTPVLILSLWTI